MEYSRHTVLQKTMFYYLQYNRSNSHYGDTLLELIEIHVIHILLWIYVQFNDLEFDKFWSNTEITFK